MNEDLHDIDDLFRNGIEGHAEEVPPGVWEAVSHDLDKKQASYYKDKYKRLKRVALVLLLLCFMGGSYVLIDLLNDRQAAGVQKSTDATTSKTISPNASIESKKDDRSATINKTAGQQQPIEQTEKTTTTNDITPNATTPVSVEKGLEKQESNGEKKTTMPAPEDFVRPGSSAIANKQSKAFLPTDKTSFVEKTDLRKQKIKKSNFEVGQPSLKADKSALNNKVVSSSGPDFFSIKHFPLLDKNYQLPGINLPSLNSNRQFLTSETAKPSGSKTKAPHDFSLSAFVAPNSNFDRLEDDDHLAGPGRNRQEAHRDEQGNHSFSAGLLVSYGLSKHLVLQSGVSITSSTTSIAPKTIYAKADNNGHTHYELHCSSGYVYIDPKGSIQPAVGDSAQASGTTTKLSYVTIPASVSYRISLGRFSLLPELGAGVNILTSGKTTTSLSSASGKESATTAITGLKPSYVDGHIGLGVEYKLNKTVSVGIRPNARLALTPINKETPVKSYQNFLSLETGVRIKL